MADVMSMAAALEICRMLHIRLPGELKLTETGQFCVIVQILPGALAEWPRLATLMQYHADYDVREALNRPAGPSQTEAVPTDPGGTR